MLSCRLVKTELFENADVTASIHYVSEHAHGSLGITQGHFACLFFYRSSNIEVCMWQRLRVDGDLFKNSPHVDAVFIWIKRDAFSKICGYVWTGP